MRISIVRCKKQIGTLWFIGSGLLFSLMFFQTIFGHYGEKADEAWGWLIPNIAPTLSLMLGVLIIDSLSEEAKDETVDRFIFRLSLFMSAVYLSTVALTILVQPFAYLSPLELLKQSNLWLRPFQGLISACIGAFFSSQRASRNSGSIDSSSKSKQTTIQ